MKYLKTFEGHSQSHESVGINWQSDFTQTEKDMIEDSILSHVSDMVKEGYTSGDLYGEEPQYDGYWSVEIQEDDNDEDIRNTEVASKISEGYTRGYYPTFHWYANVWKD